MPVFYCLVLPPLNAPAKSPKTFSAHRYLIVGILILTVSVIWISATGRWQRLAWTVPGAIDGDILEVAARVEIARQNHAAPWNLFGRVEHLGAPVGASWSGYPVSDRAKFWLAGMLHSWFGTFETINMLALLGFVAGALSFYFCARALRWPACWALTGAVLFAFAPFNYRWSSSLSLGLTFTLPPACLLFQWIARAAPAVNVRPWRLLAVAVGLALGEGNPYFAFMGGQLGVLACLLQARRGAHCQRLQVGAWFLGALIIGFLPTVTPGIIARLGGSSEAVSLVRNYSGTELYALKPVAMFIPPVTHRFAALGRLGSAYRNSTMLRGEFGFSYLGLIGGLSLIALLGFAALRLLGPGRRRIPDAALASGWVLLFSVVGGVNCLLAFAGMDIFRATGRYSIFLFTWALFFGLGSLQRRLPWRANLRWGATILLMLVGVVDQVPAAPNKLSYARAAATLAADRDTTARLTAAAAPGARVFQLPAVPFPEASARIRFSDYQHFRLFLADSSLCYSYGGMRGSLAFAWSGWVSRQKPAVMVTELQKTGFDLLTIDRRAFENRADSLIGSLEAQGLRRVELPQAPHLAAFRLVPSASLVLPSPGDPRFLEQWDSNRGSSESVGPALYAKSGWFSPERDGGQVWRWAGRRAMLVIWRNRSEPEAARLSANLSSLTRGRLLIELNGQLFWAGAASKTPVRISDRAMLLRPGANHLVISFEGPLRSPEGDERRLGVMVGNLNIVYGAPGPSRG